MRDKRRGMVQYTSIITSFAVAINTIILCNTTPSICKLLFLPFYYAETPPIDNPTNQ